MAYEWKKDDRRAGEGDIENMKVAFITNFHLFRVAFNMKMHRYIKTLKDLDIKEWIMPLSAQSIKEESTYVNKCIGKSLSDSCEAMIGALFLTATNPNREYLTGETGLYRSFKWLDDIRCLPLKTSGILKQISKVKESTLNIKIPLYELNFNEFDTIRGVYDKYFLALTKYEEKQTVLRMQSTMNNIFDDPDIGELGSNLSHLNDLKGEEFVEGYLNELQFLQIEILNYKFKDPELLLNALTHPSAKSRY